MVKINFFYCHHFSGSKLHNKMVLAILTQCFKNLGQKRAKNGQKNGQNSKHLLSSFFWLETTRKNVTSRLHTMFVSRDTNFRPFFGPNYSRTEIFTAKPMVVGCVQHYSTHFVKKLGKSLE